VEGEAQKPLSDAGKSQPAFIEETPYPSVSASRLLRNAARPFKYSICSSSDASRISGFPQSGQAHISPALSNTNRQFPQM
jgi:hypothetical protein